VAEGFAVRPGLLAAPAAALDDAAAGLRTALARARAELAALGQMCGDDEQGHAFADRYDAVATHGLDAIGRSAEAVSSFGGALRAVAEQYAAGDDGAVGGFTDRP
jgi:uncharacterized protein YukE